MPVILKLLKSFCRITIIPVIILAFIWVLIARPIFPSKGIYKPEIRIHPESLKKYVNILLY